MQLWMRNYIKSRLSNILTNPIIFIKRKLMFKFTIACLGAVASAHLAGDTHFTSMGKIDFKLASYIQLGKFGDQDLLLTAEFTGNPFANGSVSLTKGIKEGVLNGNVDDLEAKTLDSSPYTLQSPNRAQFVPADVFPDEHVIMVPDGFLIPGHKNGGVYLMIQDKEHTHHTNKTVRITKEKKDHWFHSGHWVDMNGDGLKDILIARSNGEKKGGVLLWLENPGETALDGTEWEQHHIVDGPDVYTSIDFLPQYPGEVIVWASQFFDEKLGVYRVSLTDGELIDSKIIDSDIGSAYAADLVDLNGDGKKQLLANNWQKKHNGLWAYTVPDDIINGTYEKHTIAKDFKISSDYNILEIAGPGYHYLYYPDLNDQSGRARILLCGHGNQKAWYLIPTGEPENFEYEMHEIKDFGAVIGGMAFSDFDGDGASEVWMAAYEKGFIEVFKTFPDVPDEVEFFTEWIESFLQ